MTGHRRRRMRERLMAADPHCYYCGVELVYFHPGAQRKTPLPPNFATLEHLNSRVSGPRPKDGKIVLACRLCNEGRGAAELAALGIEELRRRSGRPGLFHSDQ